MIEVSYVAPEHVEAVWPKVEKYLMGAADYTYGRFTVVDIYKSIVMSGNSLWIAFEGENVLGAVVTNMIAYPRKKMLCMQFCGGEQFDLWHNQIIALLRQSAKDNGCDGLESSARPGWARIFKDDGYSQCWVTFELPL
jgi:hypothetical protein